MRAWCDQRTRRDGYPEGAKNQRTETSRSSHFFRIVVQRHSSGHHAGNDRRRSQVNKYVAPGVEDGGLWLREAVSVRNGAGGRKRTAFQVTSIKNNLADWTSPALVDTV